MSDKKQQIDNFKQYLHVLASKNITSATLLTQIIATNAVRPLKYHKYGDHDIISFQGVNDTKLVEWGKKCGFPRGFHIKKYMNEIEMFGFYPKFENDDIGESAINNEMFNDAVKISMNKKFSGSLAIVTVINIGSIYDIIVCSKNDFDTDLTHKMYNIIRPRISNELMSYMFNNHLSFCCEVMLNDDKVHGSNHNQGFVLTCVSVNQHIKLIDENVIISGYNPSTTDHNKFISSYSNIDVVTFAKQFNLPISSVYEIDGNDKIKNFFMMIEPERNIINDNQFNEIVNMFQCQTILGNIEHSDICGSNLEGIVIKITNVNGSRETKKYKFARYTIRTMFLRTFIDDHLTNDGQIREIISDDIVSLISSYKSWSKRWLVHGSKLNTEYYWKYIVNIMSEKFNDVLKMWKIDQIPHKPAFHIYLMDYIIAGTPYTPEINFEQLLSAKIPNIFNGVSNSMFNIIFVLGGVKTGKSAYGNLIASSLPNSVHIDCDEFMNLTKEMVLSLSIERNPMTQFAVVKELMKNKNVIVSTGGGQFINYNQKIRKVFDDFFTYLRNVYKNVFDVNVTVIMTSLTDNIKESTKYEGHLVSSLYQNPDRMHRVVDQMKMPHLYDILTSVNISNETIQYELIKRLNELGIMNKIIYVPYIDPQNYDVFQLNKEQTKQTIIGLVNTNIVTKNVNPNMFKFIQHRLLASCNDPNMPFMKEVIDKHRQFFCHHITWDYDVNLLQYVDNNVQTIECDARHVEIKQGKNMCSFILVNLPNVFSQELYVCAHITVNSGPHAPASMKNIADAIICRERMVTIPYKNSDVSVTYDLALCKFTQTKVTIHTEFYMCN